MKRILSQLAVATLMSTVAKANLWRTLAAGPSKWNLPNVRDAMKGPDSKAYYVGTTEDIIALGELFKKANTFFLEKNFWSAFLMAVQVDPDNAQSDCVLEVDVMYTHYV